MTATLTDEFTIETATRRDSDRSVKFDWKIGTLPAKDGHAERDILAVLTIRHNKAGANYFSGETTTEDYFDVSLGNETVERRDGFGEVRGFIMFAGLGVARLPAGKRFSAKRLQQAALDGFAIFREHYEAGNEKVLRYFDAEQATV